MDKKEKICIIGAGISGLTAAIYLKRAGFEVVICESDSHPGGKVQSDLLNGFILDRGFQVFFTAYPEANGLLDDKTMHWVPIPPSLQVNDKEKIHFFRDPFSDLTAFLKSLFDGSISFSDKWATFRLYRKLRKVSIDKIFEKFEVKTSSIWRKYGFSHRMVHRLFRPFYSGIFLEKEMNTSRRVFDFTFKMMSEGKIAVPSGGMGSIGIHLANQIGKEHILYNHRATGIQENQVLIENGATIQADRIVIATEYNELVAANSPVEKVEYVGTCCFQFEAGSSPFQHKCLWLNADMDKLVHSIAVMSDLAPSYAPNGKTLIYVNVVGIPELADGVLLETIGTELLEYTKGKSSNWKLLRFLKIPKALPKQTSVLGKRHADTFRINNHLYLCGDHLLYGSINAAMKSGRLVAEEIILDYKRNHPGERSASSKRTK